jgi:hypothetical protein
MKQATWAAETARQLLETQLPVRWAHSRCVAAQARSLAPILGPAADLIETAAWLHDIGYSPDVARTGFHPLDGARYLRDVAGAGASLCQLVAHHSCARIEARHRGIADELMVEFPRPRHDLERALIYCDMTGGPKGAVITVDDRLADIFRRYEPGSPVDLTMREAAPVLTDSVRVIQAQLALLNGALLVPARC